MKLFCALLSCTWLIAASHPSRSLTPLLSNHVPKNSSVSLNSLLARGILFSRQEECPPGTELCAGGYCCDLASPVCCEPPGCCEEGYNCVSGEELCCPVTAITCGGSQCCLAGNTCCPGAAPYAGCCPPDSTCCAGDGCCDSGEVCCGPGCCSPPQSCGRDADTRQFSCVTPSIAQPFEIDANEFPELAENMCRSMRARGINGNEEILTRRPVPSDPELRKAEARQIRSKAKCNGITDCETSITDQSCDEYPPASTEEGYQGLFGIDVFSKCIDQHQNTRGGRRLQSTLGQGRNAIPAGSTFVSRVKNLDCNTIAPADPGPIQSFPPKSKRQSNRTETNILYPALPGDPSGFALLSFGDLNPGTYSVVITTSDRIDSWNFFDAPALDMGSGGVISPNVPVTLQFSLDLRDYGVSMVAFTSAEAIDIQWTITLTTPGNGTTATLPNTTSSSNSLSAPTSGYFNISRTTCPSSTLPSAPVTSSITTKLTVSTSCSTSTAGEMTSLSAPTRGISSTTCTTSPSLGLSGAVIVPPTGIALPNTASTPRSPVLVTAAPSTSKPEASSTTHAVASSEVVVASTSTSVKGQSSAIPTTKQMNSTTPVGTGNLSPSQFTGAAPRHLASSRVSIYGFLFIAILFILS